MAFLYKTYPFNRLTSIGATIQWKKGIEPGATDDPRPSNHSRVGKVRNHFATCTVTQAIVSLCMFTQKLSKSDISTEFIKNCLRGC